MDNSDKSRADERGLGVAAVIYSMVMLAALVIGLYGLFTLLWLAGNAVERSNHVLGLFI